MRKFAFLFILLFAIFSAFSQTTYSTITSSSVLDWNSASSWEDIDGNGTGDIPVVSGADAVGDVIINLNASLTCSESLTFNDAGSGTVTINTNGNNFTSSAAWIFVAVTGSGVSKNANVSVTGGGTVSVDTLDFPESGSHSLTVDSGSTFRIEKKFYGNANSTIMTFTGSGTLYIPASGADLNFGNSGILYDSSLEVLPVGDPSYYKISSDGSSIHSANGIGITFTVDRTGDSGATSAVPFTYTAVSKGSASLSDFTFAGSTLSSTGTVNVTGSSLTRNLKYSPAVSGATLSAGDGVTLTFKTPDGSMVLAEISWIQDEPHWTGNFSTDWKTATNWSNGSVPSGTDNVVISSGCPRYPEIDAEVEAASVVVNTNARFTVVSGGKLTASSVTCNGNSRIELPGGKLASSSFTMNDYGYINATGGTVEFTGNSTWNPNYPDRTTFYNVTVDSGAELTANCALNIDGNIEIKSGAQLTSGGDITVNGNWLNNGTFVSGSYDVIFAGSALQEITGGSSGFSGFKITGNKVKITDDFEVTGTAVLSCDIDESSTGTLSFGGNVTASSGITIGCDFDFASSGSRSFTAPAGNLYITGNADFSLCQSLTHSGGTVYLDSIASKSFTGGSTLGFNAISISGDVTLKGNVAADSITTVAGAEPAIEGSVDISSAFTVVKDSVLYIKQGGNVLSSGSGQLVLNSGTLNYTGSSAYSLVLPVVLSMDGTTPISLVSSSAELTLPDVTYNSNPNVSVTGDVTLAGGSVGKLTVESASTLTCSDSFTVEGLATLYGDVNCTDSLTFNGGIKSMDDSVVIEGTAVITSGSANTEISGEDLKINCNWTNSGSGTLTVSNALTVNGSFSSTAAIAGSGNIIFLTGSTLNSSLDFSLGTVSLASGTLNLAGDYALRATVFEPNGTVDGNAGGSTPYTLTLNVPSVTSSGNQVYNCNVSLAANTAISASGGNNITFNYPVTSGGKTLSVTTDGTGSVAFGSSGSSFNAFADSVDLILKAPAVIYGDNTFASFKADVSAFGTAKSIIFESGKTQTIDSINTKGLNGALLTLGSTSTAKWKVYFTAIPAITDFSYTEISNSESVDSSGTLRELELTPTIPTVRDTSPVSTMAWFVHRYFWLGRTNSKWSEAANWAYDGDGNLASPVPDYTDGMTEIILDKTGSYDLELADETVTLPAVLDLKSVLIKESNRFGIAGYNLSLSQSTAGAFTNNGTFALYGTQTVPVISLATGGTAIHGNDSTIEYYGTSPSNDIYCVSTASGVNYYKKLVIASGADVTFSNNTSSASIVNNGTARIPVALSTDIITFTASSAGNILNAGTGNVLITGAGTVVFAGTFTNNGTLTASSGDLRFSGNYSGTGGTFSASSSNTYFAGNADLRGTTFTHSNGTVVFNGTGGAKTLTAKADGTTVFNNVSVVAGSSVRTASSFTVSGNLINLNAPGAAYSFRATAGKITFNKNGSTDGNLTISGNNFFYNLFFASGVQSSLTDRLSVTGTTEIANGTGNAFSSTAPNTFTGRVYLGLSGAGTVQAGDVSLTGSNTFTTGVTINNADDVVLNSASGFTIATSAACDTLEVQSAVTLAGSVTTTGNQLYNGNVTGTSDLVLDAGTASITFNGNVTTNVTGGGNQVYKSAVNYSGTGNLTSSSGNQIYTKTVTCGNSRTLTTNAGKAVQLGAGLLTSASNSITVNSDLYVSGSGTLGGGTGNFTVLKNVYFACPAAADVINVSSPFNALNAVLQGGKLSLNANISATQDIVLLNGNVSSMYKDGSGAAGSGTSGIENLFRYIRSASDTNKPDTAASSLTSLPSAYPDGSTGFPDGNTNSYCGEVDSAVLAGKTLTCGKNFYANGVDLGSGASGEWNLAISDTGNASVRFAEMYNLTVANCNASYWVSAAEGCIDGDGGSTNTNIDFSRPTLVSNDSSVATNATGSGTYTVYDDVIRVEFSEPIENSNNEISKVVSSISYSGGAFSGSYYDADCTASTDGKGDLSVFYIKVPAAKKWNTDATGTSAGDSQSTTRNGEHSTEIPYINIPKALAALFATLRDEHKNRIAQVNFTAVADRCSPVLIGVQIGQELHTAYSGTYNSQPPYDAHNFIEFQYSEEVEIPGLATTGANSVNVHSSTSLGNISGTSGLSIAGLAQLSSGSISCGSNDGTAVSEIHALYRNFATTVSGVSGALSYNSSYSNPQTHRVRVALASYTSGTVTPADSKTYRKWPGYIDSLVSPVTASGTGAAITRLSNANIKDVSVNQNVLDSSGTAPNHTLPAITVNKRLTDSGTASEYDSILYGAWDTTEPSFAPFRAATAWQSPSSSTEYESLGTGLVGSTTLNRIEMHLFDNKPAYNSTDEAAWRSKRGWVSGIGALDTNLKVSSSYAADIFGGAKPFTVAADSSTASLATGGIRYSSLYNQASRFKYTDDIAQTPSESFASSDILHEVKANVFNEYNVSRNVTSLAADSLYFSIPLDSSTNFSLKQKFKIYYDGSSGTITDLAGNRLKSATIQTVDLTPPEFSIALAPLGKNKLYLLFTKVLNTEEITDPAHPTQNLNVLENMPESFEIVDIAGASPSTALQIDETVPAQIVYTGNHSTAFVLTLNANVTLNDVRNLCVAVKNNGSGEDPVTRLPANVSYIQDYIGNYTPVHKAHALSDFAVGAVSVNYIYDNRLLDEEGSINSVLFNSDSWTARDFDADQKNFGTVLTDHDLTFNVSFYDGTDDNSGGFADSGISIIYADSNPKKKSIATEFNDNTGSSCRIWLPNATSDVFSAFSDENNTGYAEYSGGTLTGNSLTFTLPVTTDSQFDYWAPGNQVSFIFGLSDSSDNLIKIRHTPVYSSEANYNGVSGTEYPLYAVRQLSSSNLASIDLWSFRLKKEKLQRGGVTILNNVINANAGESTVVQVDLSSSTNLTVAVTTLDGNIVTYLQHGRAAEGTHYYYWNGKNNAGNKVARGLYFIRIVGSGIDETRKVMVVKE